MSKDVYKRQLQAVMVGIEDLLSLTQIFFDLAARAPRHLHHPVDVAAVSYTHLDVYKRQAYGLPPSAVN